MDKLVDFLLNFYGPTPYFIVFGILLACGLGLPIPEDITLFAAGLLAYYGLTDLGLTIGLCLFGVIFGDSIIFLIGRHYGRRFARTRLFARMLSEERLVAVEKKFNQKGTKLIFAARFMPGLRAPIFFSAGMLRVPYTTFLAYDGGAALLSVPAIVGAVYYFGDNIESVVRTIQRFEHGILVVIALVIGTVAFKWWRAKRKRARGELLAALLIFGAAAGTLQAQANATSPVASPSNQVSLETFCSELRNNFKSLKWRLDPCEGVNWVVGGHSVQGRPLIYAEWGNAASGNTTLVFSAVHGDEVTPVYLGFALTNLLRSQHIMELGGSRIVVAPLVNPDGHLRSPRTRVNARGVDVNRNFPTDDWNERALSLWKNKYRSDKRRYPGPQPGSEPETQFQQELIRKYAPQKVLSIHSPLSYIDYDGPSALALARFPKEYVKECIELKKRMKAVSSGFFPGSLGNYLGQGQGIPTITLELPSADPGAASRYWATFKKGIGTMIEHRVDRGT